MSERTESHEGGCACGHVRYRVTSPPLIVHCCHCSWCQRQDGSAFAVNALVDGYYVANEVWTKESLARRDKLLQVAKG